MFSSMKAAIISIVCAIVVVFAVGSGIIYMESKPEKTGTDVTEAVQNNSNNQENSSPAQKPEHSKTNEITLDQAKQSALADAGISSDKAHFTKAYQDFDDGIMVYDLRFYSGDKEYKYEIDAVSGTVLSKDIDLRETSSKNDSSAKYIGVDKAKSIAVDYAKASADSVSFTKAKLDSENGRKIYEVEFIAGNLEYEFEIDAISGAVLDYEFEHVNDN